MHDIQSGKCTRVERDDCGLLLAGRVVDAAGLPMVPSGRTPSGISQFYLGTSSADARSRIPAARLDRNVVGVLKRVGLLHEDWQSSDLAQVVYRVVVTPCVLELQMNMRASLALWRIGNPQLGRVTVARMLQAMQSNLAQGEMLDVSGSRLHLSIPRYSRNRCVFGRRVRAMSDGEYGGVGAAY